MSALSPYGPTAARKHGQLGRDVRPRTTTIDIRSHVAVPAAAAIVAPFLDISTVPLAFFSTPEPPFWVAGRLASITNSGASSS